MQQHRGEILEKIIRKSGFSMSKLAKKLGISRNTLYNRFKDPELSHKLILTIGSIIHYDFSRTFPEINAAQQESGGDEEKSSYMHRSTAKLLAVQEKYAHLLERYNKLYFMLLQLANNNEHESLKQEIRSLMCEMEKEANAPV